MIGLTRTNGEHCVLDPRLVERVEGHPVTVVHLSDGAKYAVVESVDDVVHKVRRHQAAVLSTLYRLVDQPTGPAEVDDGEAGHPSAVGAGSVLPFPVRPEG